MHQCKMFALSLSHARTLLILLVGTQFSYTLFSKSGTGFDDEKSLLMSQMSLEKRFGQSAVFVASTLMENGGVPQSATPETLLKEAIHVISCGYEDKSDWGQEVCCSSSMFLLPCLYFSISIARRKYCKCSYTISPLKSICFEFLI